MVGMMWKSASSYGWEHLDCVRGLGFESYAWYFLCYYCYFNLWKHVLLWYDAWIVMVSMKRDWLKWLCTWVVTKGSWVQTLEMLNGNYACFYFANGDFRGKWERLTEAMGTAKGGAAFSFMMRDGGLLKGKWN